MRAASQRRQRPLHGPEAEVDSVFSVYNGEHSVYGYDDAKTAVEAANGLEAVLTAYSVELPV